MPFFRTVAGLRVSLVVYATLLLADAVLWVVAPGDWRGHVAVAVGPAFGLIATAARLRRMRTLAREAQKPV